MTTTRTTPLKPTWHTVLQEASRHHTTTIRQLADATGMRPAAARNVVLALVRRGELERSARAFDPASRCKRYAYSATDAGRRSARARRRPPQAALAA